MRRNDTDGRHHRSANPGRGRRAAELARPRTDLLGAALQPSRENHHGRRRARTWSTRPSARSSVWRIR